MLFPDRNRPTRDRGIGGRLLRPTLLTGLVCLGACAHPVPDMVPAPLQPCTSPSSDAYPVRVIGPAPGSADREVLDAWCSAVGGTLARGASRPVQGPVDRLWIVTWNIKAGEGDVVRVVDLVRARISALGGNPDHLVLLLQEAYTRKNKPPGAALADRPGPVVWPTRRVGSDARRPPSSDVSDLARVLGMSLLYAPSMLNGKPGAGPPEDRGNAVLSALPIDSATIIELPFEQQRRAVPTVSLSGENFSGAAWRLNIASVHLDLHARGWRAFGLLRTSGRRRQAEGLAQALRGSTPTLVAGDFNTSLSEAEPAFLTMQTAFPRPPRHPRHATSKVGPFGVLGFRLDYMFFRAPSSWRVGYERLDAMYGSDHYPLLGWIQF